jgi:hypothetical protein
MSKKSRKKNFEVRVAVCLCVKLLAAPSGDSHAATSAKHKWY